MDSNNNPDSAKKSPRKPRAKKAAKPKDIIQQLGNPLESRDDYEATETPTSVADSTMPQSEPTTTTPSTSSAQCLLEGQEEVHNGSMDAMGGFEAGDRSRKAATTQTEPGEKGGMQGDNRSAVAETAAVYGCTVGEIPIAHARPGETRGMCWERLRREARAVGMARGQGPGTAYEWATREVERLFPPPPPPEPVADDPEPAVEAPEQPLSTIVDKAPQVDEPTIEAATPTPPADMGVAGLGDLPESWGNLPANAQLQVEIAWVSANRLRVRSGSGVDLSRALSPAPSYSALSWLETSILFPSKFADISVKATAQQDDEREGIRREKLAIEEIRGLLAEMLEG